MHISPGSPEPLGVTPNGRGINVAVYSAHATAIELCLFDITGEEQTHSITLCARTGDVFHAYIHGIEVGTRYGLRAYGPDAPSEGHRFNPDILLVDPYALALDRQFILDATIPKAIVTSREALFQPVAPHKISWPQTIIYELNIRGFTRQLFDIPEIVRGTFAALAEPPVIAHLIKLGVTTIELMPAAAWIDERHLPQLGLHNYWGYNPVVLMAPDPRLAPGGWQEIRRATDALHSAGLEVILDVVLNHTGECDELGLTLSLRGLDNATYYRLAPDAPTHYINDTGCGNCLALDRPAMVRLAMDGLRTWVDLGGIDGFRFDLATALGRRETGFDPAAPLLTAITQDPVLRNLKLIAEPWDIGPGGYQTGNFAAPFGEWNDRFRDDIRRFWRGDAKMRGALATRIAGSADLFSRKYCSSRSINFVTAHDGFTLADLVSYTHKHNESNGEQNRDGADENISWNHGVEGPTDDLNILKQRQRDQRNLLATLMLARGTPMITMGSEFGFSQCGNNNAYAQDNPTAWLKWSDIDENLLAFTRSLIALRKAHPALHSERFLTGAAFDESGLADVEWWGAQGPLFSPDDWNNACDDTLIAILSAPADNSNTDRVAVVLHRGDERISVTLPDAREAYIWQRALDSTMDDLEEANDSWQISSRSVVLFCETNRAQPKAKPRRLHTAEANLLNRLVSAAGIAPDWWDIAGNQYNVSPDTKRSLLRAMALPADTSADISASLEMVADATFGRLLPISHMVYEDEAGVLPITQNSLAAFPRDNMLVCNETGVVTTLSTRGIAHMNIVDSLGRDLRTFKLNLPKLPLGHYIAYLENKAEVICHLTVAPRCCYQPDTPKHCFGVSLQTYALCEEKTSMGDFGTLTQFVRSAAQHGAATVGIQPLHMLFPNDRSRASPYHPSDRRYLDPIHLNLAALHDVPGFSEASQLLTNIPNSRFDGSKIDYAEIWTLKSHFLKTLFSYFDLIVQNRPSNAIAKSFRSFIDAGGAQLQKFAAFQAIADLNPNIPWQDWMDGLQHTDSPHLRNFIVTHTQALHYTMFLQFLCDRQLGSVACAAREAGLGLGLYRDLAVGCAPDGAEAWSNQDVLALGVSIGAPPDPLGPQGQVWNLPPPNPLAWRRTNFASFRATLSANMRHAGALRIDHVLGLARLFWIPDGGTAADGAYVHYPLDELVGQLALASQQASCMVIGEDLGTVPEGLRARLSGAKIQGYRVMMLERFGSGFRAARDYPTEALCCAATHDLPPLAGWWQGTDITERRALGLLDDASTEQERSLRLLEKTALMDALRKDGLEVSDLSEDTLSEVMLAAIHQFLSNSPANLLLIQVEDIAGETVSQNLPGTNLERPNWRHRLSFTIEDLFSSSRARRSFDALRGRASPQPTARP
ncbi:MAG TPA: glycogen debranching protein GlgX [Acidocella sp.]|nr:glycogen debranching protein GlgX [Acidocella sp.]